MTKNLYSVRDSKSALFLPVFESHNDATASRLFITSMAPDANNAMCAHPADYDLHFVGIFDSELGRVASSDSESRIVMSGVAANAAALHAAHAQTSIVGD